MATEMLNFRKKIFKNLLLRSHKGEAETLHKCLCYYVLAHTVFFIAVAHVVSFLWQIYQR